VANTMVVPSSRLLETLTQRVRGDPAKPFRNTFRACTKSMWSYTSSLVPELGQPSTKFSALSRLSTRLGTEIDLTASSGTPCCTLLLHGGSLHA
jgi:hypothetical protein